MQSAKIKIVDGETKTGDDRPKRKKGRGEKGGKIGSTVHDLLAGTVKRMFSLVALMNLLSAASLQTSLCLINGVCAVFCFSMVSTAKGGDSGSDGGLGIAFLLV